MRRREFVGPLAGAAMLRTHSARAQQALPVVGMLHSGSPETSGGPACFTFFEGLREAGYII